MLLAAIAVVGASTSWWRQSAAPPSLSGRLAAGSGGGFRVPSPMSGRPCGEQAAHMPYTTLLPNSFVYVDHDVADGDDARRVAPPSTRRRSAAPTAAPAARFHLPRLRFAR